MVGAGRTQLLTCFIAAIFGVPAPAHSQATATETLIRVRATEPAASASARDEPSVPSIADGIARARALRRLGKIMGPIVVELQAGSHRLNAPVRLTAEDSGSVTAPLIIRGASGGLETRLTGSFRLVEAPLPAPLKARFPASAQPNLKAYQLPAFVAAGTRIDIERRHDLTPPPVPFEIFDAQGALTPARWPNQGWTTAGHPTEGGTSFSSPDIAQRMTRWSGERDIWIGAYFRWDWSYETRPFKAWDSTNGSMSLDRPPHYGFAPRFRAVIYHAAAELDQPGEWYLDQERRLLVVWPRRPDGTHEISQAEHLLVVDGASHVRIASLTLTRTRGDAIRVTDSSFIDLTGVTIAWTGGRAAAFSGSRNSGIRSSWIEETGEGGVLLAGGNRPRLEAGRLHVADSRIRRFSRLGLTYRPAVTLQGVGHHVEGNAIHDAPHMAIEFRGNDHVIERNEIAHVVTDVADAGAIYTGRDWTAQGTVLRHNFFHDIRARPGFEVKGIYLDDFASGATIEGNVFLRVDQPVFIGGGRDNTVKDNVFVASSPAIHIDGRGLTWAADHIVKRDGELRSQYAAMPVSSPPWRARYPELARTLEDEPARPKRNIASGNLIVGGAAYHLLAEVDAGAQSLAGYSSEQAAFARTPAADAAARAKTAAELRPHLARELAAAGLARLPLERMDRRGILPEPVYQAR